MFSAFLQRIQTLNIIFFNFLGGGGGGGEG